MKTRELIAKLQELDPSGEMDVTVGKEPIYSVDSYPYYYDGRYGRIVWEEHEDWRKPIKAEYPTGDHHIAIDGMPIYRMFYDYPDLPVDYNGATHAEKRDEEERVKAKELLARLKIRREERGE